MNESWYNKCMPKIKDIAASIPDIARDIKKIDNVESLLIFGSLASHIYEPEFRIKDIDIAVKVPFHSEDLIAINKDILSNKISSLEEEGFDPKAVQFSKKYKAVDIPNLDKWCISGNDQLLHWGPIIQNKEEFDSVREEAEIHAQQETGFNLEKLQKTTSQKRYNWYEAYVQHISQQVKDMPYGWYLSEDENSAEKVSEIAIKIF